MNLKQEKLKSLALNAVRTLLKSQTYKEAFTKPAQVLPAFAAFFQKVGIILGDVKLDPVTIEDQLKIVKASVLAISTLASRYSDVQATVKDIPSVFGEAVDEQEDSRQLAAYFKSYGSDKSTRHNYYLAYASVLAAKKNEKLNIFEIGLGTNNIDVLSNMGVSGKPGASLRAFRDMYPKASVWGADIDRRVLFSEDRIQTHFVDQTDPASFEELKKQIGETRFDLIIDDGLHNSQANLNTTFFVLELLKPDGVFIIEDIRLGDFPYYQIVEAILKGRFSVTFLKTKHSCICVFRRVLA